MSSEAEVTRREGPLTKEHFISLKFFVRSGDVSGLNLPHCVGGQLVGLEYDVIF